MFNITVRWLGRFLERNTTKCTQDLLNMCYEGYPFLHHYSISYCIFVVLLGTMFSTSVPLGIPAVGVSLITRYSIDRVLLLKVYGRPSLVDGSLVKVCVHGPPWDTPNRTERDTPNPDRP